MALIASINGTTRRIYLNAADAIGGVLTFHPTDDLYFAYRAYRAANESARPFDPFLEAATVLGKGGGKFTPKFVTLLKGTKLVIPDGIDEVNITGELLTDDGSRPFDTSLVTGPCIINYQPSEAEVIKVATGGNEYSLGQFAAAMLAAMNATTGQRTLGQHLQIQTAVLAGSTLGAGTGHIEFIDGAVSVEADVPLPGQAGERSNVEVTGV